MNTIYLAITIFFVEIILQSLWIKMQISGLLTFFQAQKSYGTKIDIEKKAATPSMGGAIFLKIAILLLIFGEGSADIWLFATACGAVGYADDMLKFFTRSSEGFSSLKKLAAQIIISGVYAVWVCSYNNIDLWENIPCPVWLSVPLIIFLSVGMQNAVNITDGLDGLAAGAVALSVAGLIFAVGVEKMTPDMAAALGLVLGFLWHNSHPAKIFMGDTGSHFLAGMLFTIVLKNGSLLLLVPLGFIFGIEVFSSAIQIFSIRKFGKKIFKMAPLHHHFQLCGWKETLIVSRFLIIHILGMSVLYILMSKVFSS